MMTGAIWRSAFVAALFAWHPRCMSNRWCMGLRTQRCLERVFSDACATCLCEVCRMNDRNRGASASIFQFLSSGFYWLALLFFACGLMSKPMVVTLPFVLLLLDFWPLRRFTLTACPRLFVEKIPFFALTLASCLLTLFAQKNALWSSASLSFQFRLANALMSYVRYISKVFCPTKLALIYPYPHSWPLIWRGFALAAVLVILSAMFIIQAKRFRYLAVGWFWFLGTLVPA